MGHGVHDDEALPDFLLFEDSEHEELPNGDRPPMSHEDLVVEVGKIDALIVGQRWLVKDARAKNKALDQLHRNDKEILTAIGNLRSDLVNTRVIAQGAERKAEAARAVGERSSKTDEIITKFVDRKLSVDVQEDDEKLQARIDRRKLLNKFIKGLIPAAIAGLVGVLATWKACGH